MTHPRVWAAIAVAVSAMMVIVVAWIGATMTPRASSTASEAIFAGHVAVSAALVVSALLLTALGVRSWLAVLVAALAITLQAEILRNWQFTVPTVRTALAVLMLLGPALAVLIVAWSRDSAGWPETRSTVRAPRILKAASIGGAVAVALIALAIALVRVPLLDITCRFDCGVESWVPLPSQGGAAALTTTYDIAVASIALLAATVFGAHLRNVLSGTREWSSTLIVGAVALVLVIETVRGAPTQGDEADTRSAIEAARVFAYGVLAAVILASGLVAARRVLAERELADRLGHEAEPGKLRERFAAILDDSSLTLAFWVPDASGFVDQEGRPVAPNRSSTRVELTRHGRPLAVVVSSRRAEEARAALSQIGASARLAIDNERLLAELRYQARAIEATRRRIVERSAAERHAIERGLHDRAQAGLVAALFELARFRAAAGDSAEAMRLERALTRTHARLRELAHGVYPALLDGVGLAESVRELGTQYPITVTVTGTERRLPSPVEHALYRLVRALSEDGSELHVDLAVDERVTLTVSGAGSETPAVILDEIAVLGGRVDHDGDELRAVVPCAP